MNEDDIRNSMARVREQWRQARGEKLARKRDLLAGSAGADEVRHDRGYRDLRKKQRRYATLARHLERRLNRILAREKKES